MNQPIVTQPIHRGIKFRAIPSPEMEENLNKHFIACEEIFNKLLDANEEFRRENHRDMDGKALASLAAQEGKNYPIANRQAAYYVAPRLIYGLKRSRNNGEGQLKKKEVGGTKASFTISCVRPVIKFVRGGAKSRASFLIPQIGEVTIVNHRKLPDNAKFKLCTVSRNPSGQYFVALEYEVVQTPDSTPKPIKRPVGLDFSVPKLYVASDKALTPDARMLEIRKKYAPKISRLHKKLCHCMPNSKNHEKYRIRLAKVYQRIDNIRNDFIQKETKRIVDSYDFVGAETLSLTQMCERFKFYNSIHDDSWYHFVAVLKYKMESAGKQIRFVSKYYPSSKTCHRCGYVNHNLKLSDREYVCPVCHNRIDRDYNAAKNIRDQALRDAGYKINYIRAGRGAYKSSPIAPPPQPNKDQPNKKPKPTNPIGDPPSEKAPFIPPQNPYRPRPPMMKGTAKSLTPKIVQKGQRKAATASNTAANVEERKAKAPQKPQKRADKGLTHTQQCAIPKQETKTKQPPSEPSPTPALPSSVELPRAIPLDTTATISPSDNAEKKNYNSVL